MLNEFELKKIDVIKKVISKGIKVKEAMEILNLSERQIYRLKKIIRQYFLK